MQVPPLSTISAASLLFTLLYETSSHMAGLKQPGKAKWFLGGAWDMKRALRKRALAGLMFLVFAGAGSMMAQDGYYYRDRNLRRDYVDRRADIRDIRRDEAKIAHDRGELRRDLYYGNYRAAAHEQEELRREYRDINRDRADVYRDTRDIRRDERERYWYGR